MILLDTNVVSEAQHPRGNVAGQGARGSSDATTSHISVIVLGEIALRHRQTRVRTAPRRVSQEFYAGLRRDLRRSNPAGRRSRLPRLGRARAPATGRRGRILPLADGLIAATALVHDLTLWTRNTRDFEGTGVRLFNPWED